MPHVTSIGLDVHARSVAAAAFNPFTGEVARELACWVWEIGCRSEGTVC